MPHIFAAGDVIGYPSLAATSSEQGRLAACHAFGIEAGPARRPLPDRHLRDPRDLDGRRDRARADAARRCRTRSGVARYREIARGQILGDDSGMFKMLFHREDRRLLGIHCIGTGATELVHVGQAVLGLGGGLDYFLGDRLQLSDAGRVLQGGGARRVEQAARCDRAMRAAVE